MIVDLFAGLGGWSEGLRLVNPALMNQEIGFEWDEQACNTRKTAGHKTIRCDVSEYPLDQLVGKVEGVIASPPCQDFSLAGKRTGIEGSRGKLISEVMRWTEALSPEWVACEQVPPALPVWEEYAEQLQMLGYSTWTGVLNSADYGVPQIRRRAILMASKSQRMFRPIPSHAKEPQETLFGESEQPWLSMEDVLPSRVGSMLRHNQAKPDRPRNADGKQKVRDDVTGVDYYWRMPSNAPVWTLTSGSNAWRWERDGVETKLEANEALMLQSFPDGYPIQGSKSKQFEQAGNAIPPLLAAHVIAGVLGNPSFR
jgi:DNA (cytosine-5)-methyltransferase 1